MDRRHILLGAGVLGAAAAAAGAILWRRRAAAPPPPLSDAEYAAAFAEPVVPPPGPVATYHLGHSLVGPDMPAMLAAAAGHPWHSQVGWGTSLRDHWRGAVNGLDTGAAHRPAFQALDSGDYGAVVFTEMVELRDAIRWHDSARTLAQWAARARAGNPQVRLFLYETWHRLDDPAGWLERIDADRALWEGAVLSPALRLAAGPIHLVPGGQVMAAVTRAAEAGHVPGVADRRTLFADDIHPGDLGAWLMAMVHFAVIYGRTPEGLAAQLPRGDGALAGAPSDDAALALQRIVWQVVTGHVSSGVRA